MTTSDPTPTTPGLLSLANRLTVARVRAGLSQAEAARRLLIGGSYLSELEAAAAVPNALVLASLADTYGVTVDDLLGRASVPAPAAADRDAAVRHVRTALSRVDGRDDEVVDALLAAGFLAAPAVPAADEDQVQRDGGDEVLTRLREVRRVAQAIHDEQCGCDDWDAHESEDDDPTYLAMARAAIAALREVPHA